MRTVVVANWKGGVGKSAVAHNLAVALARRGKRTLLLDLDSQHNLTDGAGVAPDASGGTLALLVEGEPVETLTVNVEENLDLVPASRELAPIDQWLTTQMRREEVLTRRLERLKGYDIVMADTAPAFSLLNVNALAWASECWAPVNMEAWGLQGLEQLIEAMDMVRESLGRGARLKRVIPTFVDRRNSKTAAVLSVLMRRFDKRVTDPVRVNVSVSEAAASRQSVLDYAPRSSGAEDFTHLSEEI